MTPVPWRWLNLLTKLPLMSPVADLMAISDFTQYLLNDPHAPMVAVSLEEQALAPARVLARAISRAPPWPCVTGLCAS